MADIYLEIDSVPSKIILAETCWQCSGNGKPCVMCDGTGLRITADGKSILALVALDKKIKDNTP